MGLAPLIVDQIFDFLGRLVAEGAALLLVEQYVSRARWSSPTAPPSSTVVRSRSLEAPTSCVGPTCSRRISVQAQADHRIDVCGFTCERARFIAGETLNVDAGERVRCKQVRRLPRRLGETAERIV